MGVSPSDDSPEVRFPDLTLASVRTPVPLAPEPVAPRWPVRHIILFALTLLTTTMAGVDHYAAFQLDFGSSAQPVGILQYYLNGLAGGLWYSLSILAILGAHEYGHYYACRYYGIDASLPYFLPVPLLLTGTLGAFIRIREPIQTKRELFDVGIAGPIAGFLVALPVLFIGFSLSRTAAIPPDFVGWELGEPLLFQAMSWMTFGSMAEGQSVNLHPMAFAAWFGLLATALNLFPIGQLDGGHISYAVLGRRSTAVTILMVVVLVGLSFRSSSWIVWTVVTVGMLAVFGPRHPRTIDEDVPLDPARTWLAAFALLMFVLCFTPVPIEPLALLGTP